jgi:hypothetical protein
MASAHAVEPAQGGVARLVEAERQWQVTLDEARAHARVILENARAAVVVREQAADADCRTIIAARARELDATVTAARDEVRREFGSRIALYTTPSDDAIDGLARLIADRAPWFAQPGEGA